MSEGETGRERVCEGSLVPLAFPMPSPWFCRVVEAALVFAFGMICGCRIPSFMANWPFLGSSLVRVMKMLHAAVMISRTPSTVRARVFKRAEYVSPYLRW